MGWASGSGILYDIIRLLKPLKIDAQTKEMLYSDLIEIFESNDCDTIDECLDIDTIFDKVYKEKYDEDDE